MQFNDAAVIDDMWAEVILSNPITQMNGISLVIDCKDIGPSFLKWLTPKNCSVISAKFGVLPTEEWTVHLVNTGTLIKICFTFFKPFLSETTLAKVCEQVITSHKNFRA